MTFAAPKVRPKSAQAKAALRRRRPGLQSQNVTKAPTGRARAPFQGFDDLIACLTFVAQELASDSVIHKKFFQRLASIHLVGTYGGN